MSLCIILWGTPCSKARQSPRIGLEGTISSRRETRMDLELVERLKVMTRDDVAALKVKEVSPFEAICSLIEYIQKVENITPKEKSNIIVPGLEA
jgi:hypothetical protein